MGLLAAVRAWSTRDHDGEQKMWVEWCQQLADRFKGMDGVTASIIPDPPRKQGDDDEIPAPKDKEQQTVRNEEGKSTNGISSDP